MTYAAQKNVFGILPVKEQKLYSWACEQQKGYKYNDAECKVKNPLHSEIEDLHFPTKETHKSKYVSINGDLFPMAMQDTKHQIFL
jgi:hypothetical protein